MELKNHDLVPHREVPGVRYEEVPLKAPDGSPVEGLHTVWITLDNPAQLNSYTTEMVKAVILGMRRASNDRVAVAVVFTGAGDRAFCTAATPPSTPSNTRPPGGIPPVHVAVQRYGRGAIPFPACR